MCYLECNSCVCEICVGFLEDSTCCSVRVRHVRHIEKEHSSVNNGESSQMSCFAWIGLFCCWLRVVNYPIHYSVSAGLLTQWAHHFTTTWTFPLPQWMIKQIVPSNNFGYLVVSQMIPNSLHSTLGGLVKRGVTVQGKGFRWDWCFYFLFLMPLFGRRDLFWINSKTQTRNGHAEFGPLPVISVFFCSSFLW